MALSNLKNITRTYLLSSTPKRLLLFTINIGLPSQPLKPPSDYQRFTLFRNSRSPKSIWLSLIARNLLISFRNSNARTLCSEIATLDERRGPCEVTNDAEKIYKTIMEINSCPSSNLEEALDSLVGVDLTTELVAEVLHHLRFEEKLAFRFFTWAGRRDGYTHEARVYSEMINTLSNTVYKAKRFRLVCETLDYMKRNGDRSVPAEALLEILKRYCEKYLTSVWKIARKKMVHVTTQPPTSALNLLLESLCECGLPQDAEWTMMRMGQMVRPNLRTYTVLFYGWCRVRRPADAVRVLGEMTNKGFEPDNLMYTAAIETLCVPGMVDAALKVFESMRSRGGAESSPTAKTYSLIIAALVRNDRTEEAVRYLGLMMADGCVPDVPTYKVIIKEMCLAGKIDMAYRFMEEMKNRGYPADIVTYNCFLKVLCDNKRCEEALGIFRAMIEKGCEPSIQSYNMLIVMLFEVGNPDGASKAWEVMHLRGCLPGVETYCNMIDGFFRCDRSKDACSLVDEVVEKRMKLPYDSFDSILAQLSKTGNLQAIHTLSKHMRRFYNRAMEVRFNLNERRMRVRRGDAG